MVSTQSKSDDGLGATVPSSSVRADKKAEFFWGVIGDANPEPVSVVEKDGKRWAYTIGCPDPFRLDDVDANIELLGLRLIPPLKPAEQQALREERERRLGPGTPTHGWRRWNP